MLAIEPAQLVRRIGGLPATARVGLLVMALGAALTTVTHLFAGDQAHMLPGADAGHLVAIAGMVVVWCTVVLDARRRQPIGPASRMTTPGGSFRDAHR